MAFSEYMNFNWIHKQNQIPLLTKHDHFMVCLSTWFLLRLFYLLTYFPFIYIFQIWFDLECTWENLERKIVDFEATLELIHYLKLILVFLLILNVKLDEVWIIWHWLHSFIKTLAWNNPQNSSIAPLTDYGRMISRFQIHGNLCCL